VLRKRKAVLSKTPVGLQNDVLELKFESQSGSAYHTKNWALPHSPFLRATAAAEPPYRHRS